jgi:hypothetical protein
MAFWPQVQAAGNQASCEDAYDCTPELTTTAGRMFCISEPLVGLRSTCHTSPRLGECMLLSSAKYQEYLGYICTNTLDRSMVNVLFLIDVNNFIMMGSLEEPG